jgi:hypothetical protein
LELAPALSQVIQPRLDGAWSYLKNPGSTGDLSFSWLPPCFADFAACSLRLIQDEHRDGRGLALGRSFESSAHRVLLVTVTIHPAQETE